MAWKGAPYAVTASAKSVTEILGLSKGVWCRHLAIKNAGAAANRAYLGGPGVTGAGDARVELSADQAKSWEGAAQINTDEVFVVGTAAAANIVYIDLIE